MPCMDSFTRVPKDEQERQLYREGASAYRMHAAKVDRLMCAIGLRRLLSKEGGLSSRGMRPERWELRLCV
jgi:hypothetical protein